MTDPSEGERLLSFEIRQQPDDVTCGVTCLHAIYRYFEDEMPYSELLEQVPTLELGGTLGVLLAQHALARGYDATILTWNLNVFDPTWFDLPNEEIVKRLRARAAARRGTKLSFTAKAYAEFIERGGKVELRDLAPGILRKYLRKRVPLLTGLSATFLYREVRDLPDLDLPDDINGEPVGHFTVLTGYTPASREVFVSDPMHPNPLSTQHTYPVKIDRVVGAIYLGVLTYDANVIAIQPGR